MCPQQQRVGRIRGARYCILSKKHLQEARKAFDLALAKEGWGASGGGGGAAVAAAAACPEAASPSPADEGEGNEEVREVV